MDQLRDYLLLDIEDEYFGQEIGIFKILLSLKIFIVIEWRDYLFLVFYILLVVINV
jgi:hypothetical protein